MNIRPMHISEVNYASELIMAAFFDTVAHTLPRHGIESFRDIVSADSLRQYQQDGALVLVAEEEHQVIGLGAIRAGRHIGLLFVEPQFQRRGIGKALIKALLDHREADTVTVRASVPSIPAYEHYGFHISGQLEESAGIISQPMQRDF
ncbi:GNAT family N-acetyltransferase [Aliamphritea hakodatensis]|uniref:GNAT family N-acetyltransferase n=1 Tax=Aliamphritea hakodatensis TaxID=2895352 RepID=UPI0022FD564C|nr:GNAT family N-acetyltransferase [Aliamphritea hakodatensis]